MEQTSANPLNLKQDTLQRTHDRLNSYERLHKRTQTCTGFEYADWKKALQQKKNNSNRYYKDSEVSGFVSLPFFKMYGSGIYLFFAFVWDVTKFFIILSLISLVPIIYNSLEGNALDDRQSSINTYITGTSIGAYRFPLMEGSEVQKISRQHKLVNVIADLVGCIFFLGFYFFWNKKSENIQKEIMKEIELPSQSTIQITQFPQFTNIQMIQDYMNRFGKVSQVAVVKNYSQTINLSKQIYEIELQIKDLTIEYTKRREERQNELQKKIHEEKINKLEQEKKKLEIELEHVHCDTSDPIKYFVTFQSTEEKNQVLKTFHPYQRTFSCCFASPPKEMLLNDQKVFIKNCKTEPTGIIWENVHITWWTRWVRFLIQFLLILTLVGGGFVTISVLNVLVPSYDTNIDTSEYTWETISVDGVDQLIVQTWCIKNLYEDDEYSNLCQTYWDNYIKSIVFQVGISLIIVAFKFVIKIIMIKLAKFQRYTNHTDQSVTMMTNLMVSYISTTVLITFLMQANIFGISFKSVMRKFTTNQIMLKNMGTLQQYHDLNPGWYNDIGYQIWFNMLIESLIPHIILPIVHLLKEKLNQCRASNQVLHKKMFELLQAEEFQIEDSYAQILMIIFVGFMFGGGMPAIIPVCLLGLASRYIYCKYVFIRFCRVPKAFREALNDRTLRILQITLICRGIISIVMYGAKDIFLIEFSSISSWSDKINIALFEEIAMFVSRVFLTWYYSMFIALFLLIFILKGFLINLLIGLCTKDGIEEDVNKTRQIHPENGSEVQSIGALSQRATTKSYRLQQNPDYIEILAIMKMKERKINKMHRQSIKPEFFGQAPLHQ